MFVKREPRRLLELNHDELVLLRKVMLFIRNKLLSEGKPIDDINEIIIKLY